MLELEENNENYTGRECTSLKMDDNWLNNLKYILKIIETRAFVLVNKKTHYSKSDIQENLMILNFLYD